MDADWIETIPLDSSEQLVAFAYYEQRLVGPDGRNVGECGVLALAETTPHAIAVVDDRVAGNAAKGRKVEVRRTLGLLCDAIRQGLLTVPLVSALADDLLRDSYRLPFGPGGFARWADEQGLILIRCTISTAAVGTQRGKSSFIGPIKPRRPSWSPARPSPRFRADRGPSLPWVAPWWAQLPFGTPRHRLDPVPLRAAAGTTPHPGQPAASTSRSFAANSSGLPA